ELRDGGRAGLGRARAVASRDAGVDADAARPAGRVLGLEARERPGPAPLADDDDLVCPARLLLEATEGVGQQQPELLRLEELERLLRLVVDPGDVDAELARELRERFGQRRSRGGRLRHA